MMGRWEYSEQGVADRTYFRFFTRVSLIQVLQEAGFEIISQMAVRLSDSIPPSGLIEVAKQMSSQENTASYLGDYKYLFKCRKFE
jgi:hypothetical protein